MNKKIKTLFAIALATSIAISSFTSALAADSINSDRYHSNKITEQLYEQLSTSDIKAKIPTVIWFRDIDQEAVMTEATEAALSNISSYSTSAFNIAAQSPWQYNKLLDEWTLNESHEKSHEFVDEFISLERKIASKQYKENNQKLILNNIPDNEILFKSKYSPMVIANLSVKEIHKLNNNPDVEVLDYYFDDEYYAEDDIEEETMPDSTAYNFLGVIRGHSSYFGSGTGIKIGQIEPGVPDIEHAELENSNIVLLSSTATVTPHATSMARFMVGSNGLAPSATLYCIDSSGFYSKVEQLLDKGVNIINMSFGSTPHGEYGTRAKWLDHVISYHKVAVVKSAGNNGLEDNLITAPGMSYNSIVVGNIDKLSPTHLDVHSCTEEAIGIADKPDFTCIGAGTSQAAAITTGVIALMMEKKPSIKPSTRIIKALLAAGSEKDSESHSTIGGIMTDECGAGMINAYKACTSAYYTKSFSAQSSSSDPQTYTRVIASSTSKNKQYRVAMAWHMNSNSNCDSSTTTSSIMNQYKLEVYQGDTCIATLQNVSGHKNNLLAMEFSTQNSEELSFKITCTENNLSGTNTDGVCVAYKVLN